MRVVALTMAGVLFVPATGKSRSGARGALKPVGQDIIQGCESRPCTQLMLTWSEAGVVIGVWELKATLPLGPALIRSGCYPKPPVYLWTTVPGGVFLQGLVVYRGDDIIFERHLEVSDREREANYLDLLWGGGSAPPEATLSPRFKTSRFLTIITSVTNPFIPPGSCGGRSGALLPRARHLSHRLQVCLCISPLTHALHFPHPPPLCASGVGS